MFKDKFNPSSAASILLMSSMAYICTFIYEGAYFMHFGVPFDYISIKPELVIAVGISIFLALSVSIYLVLGIHYIFIGEKKDETKSAFSIWLYSRGYFYIPMALFILASPLTAGYKVFFLTVPFSIMWSEIIIPIVLKLPGESYQEAYSRNLKYNSSNDTETQENNSKGSILSNNNIFMVSIFCIFLSAVLGQTKAASEQYFFTNSNNVLIRDYGDRSILVEVENSALTGKYLINTNKDAQYERSYLKINKASDDESNGNIISKTIDNGFSIIYEVLKPATTEVTLTKQND